MTGDTWMDTVHRPTVPGAKLGNRGKIDDHHTRCTGRVHCSIDDSDAPVGLGSQPTRQRKQHCGVVQSAEYDDRSGSTQGLD